MRAPPRRSQLGARFYRRDTAQVARELLGKKLVVGACWGTIVETEAYLGPEDTASHARFGRTVRSALMYDAGGLAYVYLIYGMYHLFNVVTGSKDCGGAVLVRAVQLPDERPTLCNGPGKLSRQLGITVAEHNGLSLVGRGAKEIWIAEGENIPEQRIASGPRIGVDYAGEWASAPLRFWIDQHPAVSRAR